jgi:hypothetical protein
MIKQSEILIRSHVQIYYTLSWRCTTVLRLSLAMASCTNLVQKNQFPEVNRHILTFLQYILLSGVTYCGAVEMLSVQQKDTAINLKWYQQRESDGHGDTDRNLSDGHGNTDRNLSDGHGNTDRNLLDGHGGTDRNSSDGHGGTDRNLSDGHGDTDQNLSDGHGGTDQNLSDGHGGTDRNLSDGHGGTDKCLSNSDSIERSSCFPTDGRG